MSSSAARSAVKTRSNPTRRILSISCASIYGWPWTIRIFGRGVHLNGVPQHDRQNNSRGGATVSIPVGKGQSLKLAWARGVSTRIGSDFDTIGAAWQMAWF